MLLPNSAEMKIAQQPLLSKEALLSLTSLLVTLPDIEDRVRDNCLSQGSTGGEVGPSNWRIWKRTEANRAVLDDGGNVVR